MYPIGHAVTVLILRERFQLTRTYMLLLAVQLPGLLWALLVFSGIKHHVQYPYFLLGMIELSLITWLILKKALRRPVMCWAFSIGIASYAVLDLITGRPDILTTLFGDKFWGLNLYTFPIAAMAVEMGYGVFCWRLSRGRIPLLATIILFNMLNVPLIFPERFPAIISFIGMHPTALPVLFLLQIFAASFLVWLFAIKPISKMSHQDIKLAVSERYGKVAADPSLGFNFPLGRKYAESLGYPVKLLDSLPPTLWKSFTGAGNPHEFIHVKEGYTVLDLGCGAGLDLYIYSRDAGPAGKVYGLDISGNMIRKAETNMMAVCATNVELLHAPSDCIPLADNSVDLVTANGIYNLSPDKDAVMREVYRVLKPCGKTVFAEIMLTAPFKAGEQKNLDDWFKCIGGALTKDEFLRKMACHGFKAVEELWAGRNARTSHKLAVCAVISAFK